MIPTKNLHLVQRLSQILFTLHVIPFTWNCKQEKYLFFPQRLYFSYLHVLITISHLLLGLIQLSLCLAKTSSCHASDVSATCFTLTFMSLALTSHATLLQDATQVTISHNLIEKFVARITLDHLRQSKFEAARASIILIRIVPSIAFSMIFVGILGVIKCWLLPDLPVYFTCLIPQKGSYYKFLRALISLAFSYFVFCSALLCSFIISHGVSTMPMFLLLMRREFKPGLDKSLYFTHSSFRLISHLTHSYRQLEILLKVYLDVYALMLLPIEAFLTLAIISYNCCFILYRSYLDPIQLLSIFNGMMLASSILTLVFEMSGRFCMYAKRTLAWWGKYHWSSHPRRMEMSRFARSCRPLHFCYKGYRRIQRGTLLGIGRSIGVNTFRTVKMLRK